MLVYKTNVMQQLKEKGYNTTRILKENILSQSAMQKIRTGEVVGLKVLDQLCGILECDVCDLIEYRKEK